jgi:hypothetical protein
MLAVSIWFTFVWSVRGSQTLADPSMVTVLAFWNVNTNTIFAGMWPWTSLLQSNTSIFVSSTWGRPLGVGNRRGESWVRCRSVNTDLRAQYWSGGVLRSQGYARDLLRTVFSSCPLHIMQPHLLNVTNIFIFKLRRKSEVMEHSSRS